MIDPTELRIGNWILDIKGSDLEFQVEARHLFRNDFRPIPITPMILEQCGFKGNDWEMDHYNSEIELTGYGTLEYVHSGKDFCINSQYLSYKLLHLHQLQNLYYALTATELIRKLKYRMRRT